MLPRNFVSLKTIVNITPLFAHTQMKTIIALLLAGSLMAQQAKSDIDTLKVNTVTLESVTVSALRAKENTPMAFTNISNEE